tara:strand:+ start:104 stop:718 length:615 start_codon:yes stop_codon:yes gene_type:complete
MTRLAKFACAVALASVSTVWAQDGNADNGQALAHTCAGCHGIPGYTNAYPTFRVPRLGGQHPEYIVSALTAYKSGQRSHPTMTAQAASLTDQQIRDIAAYVTQAPASSDDPDIVPAGDPKKGEQLAQTCTACHGATGAPSITQYPILAGQHPDYLAHALNAYKTGQRNNAIMSGFASNLSKDDIKHLAAWFASQNEPLYTPNFE